MGTELATKSERHVRAARTLRKGRTEEDRQRGLLVLATCGGNTAEASRRLTEQGHAVPRTTLEHWRDTNPERFHELQKTHSVEIGRSVAAKQLELAHQSISIEAKALLQTEAQLDAGTVKDASTVARNLAVARKVNVDGSLQLEGRPTSIVEHRQDVQETLRSLASRIPGFHVDGHAIVGDRGY